MFRYCAGIDRGRSGALPGRWQASASEHQPIMNRKAIQQIVKSKGIETAMRLPKGTLTAKQKRFAEAVAMGNTGADAYRLAYNATGKPKTVGNHASALKQNEGIQREIARIERAQELAALHSAQGLHSIVISTLAEIATNPDEKGAVRVQAVRSIGQLVGVDAFRETKRVEHTQGSGEIKDQIMQQLKTLMLGSADAEIVEVDSLLAEIAGDDSGAADTHPEGGGANQEWDSGSHVHTIPLKASQEISEHPPSPPETHTPGGDIFGENDEVSK